jgi:hypothetical protein
LQLTNSPKSARCCAVHVSLVRRLLCWASIPVVLLSARGSAVCTGLYRQLTKSVCCCTALCVYRIVRVQAAVLASIPVVFFTAKGIPGEVEERVDTPAGLVAASMRAMGLGEWRGAFGRWWFLNTGTAGYSGPCAYARNMAAVTAVSKASGSSHGRNWACSWRLARLMRCVSYCRTLHGLAHNCNLSVYAWLLLVHAGICQHATRHRCVGSSALALDDKQRPRFIYYTGDDKDDEEAEYAWLPYDNIKPFALGDVSGNDDGQAPADPVLLASVAAAEAALRAATAKQQQQAASRASGSGFAAAAGVLEVTDEGSDSDGGWGVSREVRCGCEVCSWQQVASLIASYSETGTALAVWCAWKLAVSCEVSREVRCACEFAYGYKLQQALPQC